MQSPVTPATTAAVARLLTVPRVFPRIAENVWGTVSTTVAETQYCELRPATGLMVISAAIRTLCRAVPAWKPLSLAWRQPTWRLSAGVPIEDAHAVFA